MLKFRCINKSEDSLLNKNKSCSSSICADMFVQRCDAPAREISCKHGAHHAKCSNTRVIQSSLLWSHIWKEKLFISQKNLCNRRIRLLPRWYAALSVAIYNLIVTKVKKNLLCYYGMKKITILMD